MAVITIWHNTRCSKSRKTLAILQAQASASFLNLQEFVQAVVITAGSQNHQPHRRLFDDHVGRVIVGIVLLLECPIFDVDLLEKLIEPTLCLP